MNLSLRTFALALVGVAATVGAVGPVGASGETGGHFTVEAEPYTLKANENATHFLEYSIPGMTGVVCEPGDYTYGPNTGKTFDALRLGGSNNEPCKTTGGVYGETKFHYNGCELVIKIGKKSTQDNTTELVCPIGKELEITHQGCVIKVPTQVGFKGVAYNTVIENNKHAITAKFTVGGESEMSANFEGGFCTLLGTKHPLAITGSLTIWALDDKGAPIGITATGSEG